MDEGDFSVTSIGRCPYEFLETFTLKDLQQGRLKYAELALKHLRTRGIDDPDVTHYAKVRVSTTGTHVAAITLSLSPYGEIAYTDTIAVDAQSWPGILPAVLAYIAGALGWSVGDRVTRRQAVRMMEWLESVAAIHGETGTARA